MESMPNLPYAVGFWVLLGVLLLGEFKEGPAAFKALYAIIFPLHTLVILQQQVPLPLSEFKAV